MGEWKDKCRMSTADCRLPIPISLRSSGLRSLTLATLPTILSRHSTDFEKCFMASLKSFSFPREMLSFVPSFSSAKFPS